LRGAVEGTEARMQRWAAGDVNPQERAFEPVQWEDEPKSPEEQERRARAQALRSAQRQAERELRDLSPESWDGFVRATAKFFEFSADQKSRAEALQAEYEEKAGEIRTPDWQRRALAVRTQWYLLQTQYRTSIDMGGDQPGSDPGLVWLHHLDTEWKALERPVWENDEAFRHAVIGLASPEQRAAALNRVAAMAARHGVTPDELVVIRELVEKSPFLAGKQ
jgi:hypothetical protein